MDVAQSNPRRSLLFRVSDRTLGWVIHLGFLLSMLLWLGWAVHVAIQEGHWTRDLTMSCLVTLGWISSTYSLWKRAPAAPAKSRGAFGQLLRLCGVALPRYILVLVNLARLGVTIPRALWEPLVLMIPLLVLFIPYWLRRSEAAEREASEAASIAAESEEPAQP